MVSRSSWAVLAFATALLPGCASSPLTVTPEVPLPDSWPATSSQTQMWSESEWWLEFGDPALEQLIAVALETNRDLRVAATRLDMATAQARIAGASLKPQVSRSWDGSRRRQNFIGLPIPGAEGSVLSNTSTTFGTTFNVAWEVDLWGRLRALRGAATDRAEAAGFDVQSARLSIAGQTAKAWFSFVEASQQLALATDTFETRRETRERIERRYLEGLRTALDLRLAVASEATAESAVSVRRQVLDGARRQVEVLVARDQRALEVLDRASLELPALPAAPGPGVPSELLRRRPDLRASEERLAGAGLDVRAAHRALYPRLSLTGTQGASSDELSDLVDSDFSVWSLAAGVFQPLLQGGRLRAGVDLSEAQLESTLAQHEGAVIRALIEVEAQLSTDSHLAAQHQAAERAKEAARAAYKLATDRYFAGLGDYLSVLAAEEQATRAAAEVLQVDRRRLDQRVDLVLALGASPAEDPLAANNEPTETSVSELEDSK